MGVEQRWGWLAFRRSTWHYWIARFLPASPLTPLRITALYSLFGFAGLFFSDVLLIRYVADPLLSQLQALKGAVEVLLSAGLIFALTSRRETQFQRKTERIDHQRQVLDVLHRVLRHNLRNDVCVVRGYATQIRDHPATDSLREECDAILATAEKMTAYTEQASRINRLAQNSETRQRYDAVENLPEVIDDHPLVTSETDVSTTLPDRATVEVNPLFEETLDEVIANAVEHNDAETPAVEITVRPESSSHLIEVRVADNGPGIPASELEPLRAGREEQLLHISGMGLWFVKWTIDQSGGELAFEENQYGGTTVRMRVPKAPEGLLQSLSLRDDR